MTSPKQIIGREVAASKLYMHLHLHLHHRGNLEFSYIINRSALVPVERKSPSPELEVEVPAIACGGARTICTSAGTLITGPFKAPQSRIERRHKTDMLDVCIDIVAVITNTEASTETRWPPQSSKSKNVSSSKP